MNKLEDNNMLFENIKHIDDNGNEYWLARELQRILEYKQWRRFENVINKSKIACNNSNISVDDHFANVGKMVDIGSNTKEKLAIICYQDMRVTLLPKMVILEKR